MPGFTTHRYCDVRPKKFRINRRHSLYKSARLLGLGAHHGTEQYFNSVARGPKGPHGTLTNMDPATDWVFDAELGRWCLDFDGADDIVDFGVVPSLNLTGPFTLSAWGRRDDTLEYGRIFSLSDTSYTAPYEQWSLGFASYSEMHFYAGIGAGSFTKIIEYTLTSTLWQHYSLTCDGSSAMLYVDGKPVSSPTALGGAINSHPTYVFSLGNTRFINNNVNYRFDGAISDPLIFGRVLSPSEIQQLADPSNVMLSGLILPPARELWPVATIVTPTPTIQKYIPPHLFINMTH